MDGFIEHQTLDVKLPTMITAFAGWPDAAEAATRAIRYLVRKLPARKFAEIDPEEFYDFTVTRPHTRMNRRGRRVIRWPRNDFYYFTDDDDESKNLLLFVGTEPNLKMASVLQDHHRCCGQEPGQPGRFTGSPARRGTPHTRTPRHRSPQVPPNSPAR